MRIPAFPELSFEHLLQRPSGDGLFAALYGQQATGFYQGRGALWRGLKLLGLDDGDAVLTPSYHCGVEVAAVRQAGLTPQFYRVGLDMRIDLEGLEAAIGPRCRAVLVIHYYGFAQAIDEIAGLCRRRGLWLIEDCAHALLSRYRGRLAGTYGDMAVFSPVKSLPMPDGGALLLNHPARNRIVAMTRPNRALVYKRTLGLLARRLEGGRYRWAGTAVASIGATATRRVPDHLRRTYNMGDGFDPGMGNIAMSEVSRRILDGTPAQVVFDTRRRNYRQLLQRTGEIGFGKACHASLPDGTCPLFFPIRVPADQRRTVRAALRRLGVDTYVFGEHLHPALEPTAFPEAIRLSQEVLCLPVHQHLGEEQIDSVAQALTFVGAQGLDDRRGRVALATAQVAATDGSRAGA